MSRLIDAEPFEVFMTNYKGYDMESYMAGVEAVLEAIDNAPTIEPVKGKWITNDCILNRKLCSNCNMYFDMLEADNFCPNCGADMRED